MDFIIQITGSFLTVSPDITMEFLIVLTPVRLRLDLDSELLGLSQICSLDFSPTYFIIYVIGITGIGFHTFSSFNKAQ